MNPVFRFLALASLTLLALPLSAQSNRGAWSGSNTYVVGDTVTFSGNTYVDIQPTGPVTTVTGGNLFNPATLNLGFAINSDNGSLPHYGGNFEATDYIPVPSGGAFVTNITINTFPGIPNFGIAFYDSNKYYTSGIANVGNTNFTVPGIPIPVPNGSSYVRFWYLTNAEGVSDSAAIVNAGTTLQSVYTPYGAPGNTATTPAASPIDTTHWNLVPPPVTSAAASSPVLPYTGKKMYCLGDSILYANPSLCGAIAARLGATLSSVGSVAPGVDAQNGRTFDSFNYVSPGTPSGPISPQALADVDVLLLMLGTDQDAVLGLGLPTDAPSLNRYATMSAQMRAMLESILQWKLGIRVIVVGPYQTNRYNIAQGVDGLLGSQDSGHTLANAGSLAILKNIDSSMRAVCNLYGIPYIDLYNTSGVNFSTSTLWLADGLHPSPLGYTAFYIPTIANAMVPFAPQ